MRYITFSRTFPKGHIKEGQPTHFPVAIQQHAKEQTIRRSPRWKPGDKFSARIWTGKPYASKQQEIGQYEIKWTYRIDIDPAVKKVLINGREEPADWVAFLDALLLDEFWSWFKTPVVNGQLISWDPIDRYPWTLKTIDPKSLHF